MFEYCFMAWRGKKKHWFKDLPTLSKVLLFLIFIFLGVFIGSAIWYSKNPNIAVYIVGGFSASVLLAVMIISTVYLSSTAQKNAVKNYGEYIERCKKFYEDEIKAKFNVKPHSPSSNNTPYLLPNEYVELILKQTREKILKLESEIQKYKNAGYKVLEAFIIPFLLCAVNAIFGDDIQKTLSIILIITICAVVILLIPVLFIIGYIFTLKVDTEYYQAFADDLQTILDLKLY